MRAAATMATMALAASLFGCNLGDVGGEASSSSCALAAQHVATCLGASTMEAPATCDATAAAQADGVLQKDCSELVPAGERNTMFIKNLICQLLPFMCPVLNGGNNGQPGIFRINDCWNDPQWGFCYDIIKVGDNCSTMLDRPEWQQPKYSHYECREPNGVQCRLVRVCQQFADKGQCNSSVPFHKDLARCQGEKPGQPAPNPNPNPNPKPGQSCNNDGDCGADVCMANHKCVPLHSQPGGASCQIVTGAYRADVCQQGLGCKVSVAGGQVHSECAPMP